MVDNSYVRGKTGLAVPSTESGLDIDLNYFGLHGIALRVSNTNATQLKNIPCSVVVIQNEVGNGNIYVGGIGDAAATTDKDFVIYPGGSHPFPVNNANLLTVIGDNDGEKVRYHIYRNSTTEPTIDYTVPPAMDTTAPTVSSTSPANSATNVATNAEIYAIFSEEINEDSVTASSVTISPSVSKIVYRDSIDPTKIVIDPVSNLANATVYTITWTTDLEDLAGNNLAGNHVISFTTAAAGPPPDTTPPTIASRTPASGATAVEPSSNMTIVFDETIQSGSVNTTNFILKKVENNETITTTVSLGADSKTVTIDPTTSLLFSKVYSLTVKGGSTGVQDTAGNDFASDSTWTFTTKAATESIIYNIANSDNTEEMGSSYQHYIGTWIQNTSHPMYNDIVNKVKVRARKVNSPTGTLEVWVLDEDFNELYQIGTGYNVTGFTGSSSSSSEGTIEGATNTTPLAVGQYLCVKYTGGNSTDRIRLMINETNAQANASLVWSDAEGVEPEVKTSFDFAAIIYEYS